MSFKFTPGWERNLQRTINDKVKEIEQDINRIFNDETKAFQTRYPDMTNDEFWERRHELVGNIHAKLRRPYPDFGRQKVQDIVEHTLREHFRRGEN